MPTNSSSAYGVCISFYPHKSLFNIICDCSPCYTTDKCHTPPKHKMVFDDRFGCWQLNYQKLTIVPIQKEQYTPSEITKPFQWTKRYTETIESLFILLNPLFGKKSVWRFIKTKPTVVQKRQAN